MKRGWVLRGINNAWRFALGKFNGLMEFAREVMSRRMVREVLDADRKRGVGEFVTWGR